MKPRNSPEIYPLLKQVSRSFYLTLRALPGPVRHQIGLAYLLARATDTIADTELLPFGQRMELLEVVRGRIAGVTSTRLQFTEILRLQDSSAERYLLEHLEEFIRILDQTEHGDQQRIRRVLDIISGGQKLDLDRFRDADSTRIIALRTREELEDYTYRVAGCVGEFWTRMCLAHLATGKRLDAESLMADSIRFGNGLQMVNILRDIPRDVRQGRCYIPLTQLQAASLTPQDLLQPSKMPQFRPTLDEFLATAWSHLAAGWTYTCSLPRSWIRVRLACAWPILIGAQTLQRLGWANVLDDSERVKITRNELRWIMLQSIVLYPSETMWRKQFEKISAAERRARAAARGRHS